MENEAMSCRLVEEGRQHMSEGDMDAAVECAMRATMIFPSLEASDLLEALKRIQRGYEEHDPHTNGVHGEPTPPTEPQQTKHSSKSRDNAEKQKIVEKILKSLDKPHEVLGVPLDASEAEVRRAHNILVRIVHPDKNKAKGAAEAFQALNHAKEEILKKIKLSNK